VQVVTLDIDKVIPYARNPRKNGAAVAKVASSIKEFGFRQPIVVDESHVVIVGHTRLAAARLLGLTTVPVHVATNLSDAKIKAYRLADNRTHEEAEWDTELLALELEDLRGLDFDLSLTGFDDEELDDLLASTADDSEIDTAPAVPEVSTSRQGDVWILGPHRVMCGDATQNMAALMAGVLADIVWTDPPYNVDYADKSTGSNSKRKQSEIKNDSLDDKSFYDFLFAVCKSLMVVMRPGAAIYVAHSEIERNNFTQAFKNAGFKLSGVIIWKKNSIVLGRSDYQWMHEPILYGWKPGSKHRWYGGRKKKTVMDLGEQSPFVQMADGRYMIRVGDRVMVVDGDATVEEVVPSIIHENMPHRSDLHPTMKPVALVERMLKHSARSGDIVLDPCGGSGSTLIAADRLGMCARLMEIDPGYCDVILLRWSALTGRQPVLEQTGALFSAVQADRAV